MCTAMRALVFGALLLGPSCSDSSSSDLVLPPPPEEDTLEVLCGIALGTPEGDEVVGTFLRFLNPLPPDPDATTACPSDEPPEDVAELVDALRTSPSTLFVPTNDAFAGLPFDVQEALTRSPEILAQVLTYHALPQLLSSADLALGTADRPTLLLNPDGSTAVITTLPSSGTVGVVDERSNERLVFVANIQSDLGIIHIVDGVLLPASLEDAVNDVLLADSLQANLSGIAQDAGVDGLVSLTEPAEDRTLLLPTDDALVDFLAEPGRVPFDQMDPVVVEALVLTHVVPEEVDASTLEIVDQIPTELGTSLAVSVSPSGDIQIADVRVVFPDLAVTAGVAHGIDALVLPPFVIDEAEALSPSLASLLDRPGLSDVVAAWSPDVLGGADPITLLLPVDDALAALEEAEDGEVRTILLRHAVQGAFTADRLRDQTVLTTLGGEFLQVETSTAGVVRVATSTAGLADGAVVTLANRRGLDGVVHDVDRLLTTGVAP
ncbi:MAG: fasciclin domain-containing protein [Myxococcota bacterium]